MTSEDSVLLPSVAERDGLRDERVARLVSAFLAAQTPKTLEAYRSDLGNFQRFVTKESLGGAARQLLGRGLGEANALALAYRTSLVERGLAPATVNRHLAALRSLVKLARTLGMVGWALEVQNLKRESYRDTRGPGRLGFLRVLAELTRTDAKGLRDVAALRLLFDLALRRAEVVALDLEDLDLDGGTVAVLGKGRSDKVKLTLPDPTKQALASWLTIRGSDSGPLFTSCDRARKGSGRLTAGGIYRMVRALGERIGIRVRPHGLRHAAITEALDLTHGNLRAVQRFSRHRDVRVLTVYDDSRADLGGEVAKLVAGVAVGAPVVASPAEGLSA